MKKLKEEAQELINFGNSKEKAKGFGMMQVIEHLENEYYPKWKSICWSILDFEDKAISKEKSNWKNVYDKTKFKFALEKMIQKHDANVGITWNTVEYYLEEYCKKNI